MASRMTDRTVRAASGPSPPTAADVLPSRFIDSDHDAVRDYVERVVEATHDEREIVSRLFASVRDEIRYDPYSLSTDPRDYRASSVLRAGKAYCVPKSVLLTAAARAAGIPARLGFADVRNHLQSERLLAVMGTDLFVYHGYSVLFVGGRWVKASCAFNAELCARFGVAPLDFDGTEDALLHAFASDGARHMEYLRDHGSFADLPFDRLMEVYRATYPNLSALVHDSSSSS